MPRGRVDAFSDGVLAIVITLLVFQLQVPEVDRGESLAGALVDQWPSYVAYLVAFLQLGVIWINHHRVFGLVRTVDPPLLVLNLHLLLWVALIPWPTAVVAAELGDGGEHARTAVALFSAVLALTGAAFTLLFHRVVRHPELRDVDLPRGALGRFGLGVAAYALAVAVAFVAPVAALVLHVVMALYYVADQTRAVTPTSPS